MTSTIIKTAKISSELFILLFGLWTISSNLAVVFQLPFQSLALLFPALLITAFFLLKKYQFFAAWKEQFDFKEVIKPPGNNANRVIEVAFLMLIITMLFIALFVHRYNFDDAHYIRTSVDMVDHPQNPVLLKDALGLFEGAPLFIPVYKTHAIETFCAGISSLTGIPVIYVFHFLLPVVGLFLSVLAYLMLFRVLIPQKALLATLVSFALIYVVSLRAMGNFTLIRMHQGKGFLLGVVLPLIIAYGLKSARESKGRNWLMLALLQICAIGMNATALWLAPVVANLSVIAGSLAHKPRLLIRNAALGILSSAWVVLFGLYIVSNFQMPPFYITHETEALKIISGSIHRVFGSGIAMYLSMFIIFFCWLFAPNRLTRILCLVFPAFLLFIFYNPMFVTFMAQNVVSEQTYWRTAWLIPIQLFVGIIGVSVFIKSKPVWLVIPKAIFVVLMFFIFIIDPPTKSRIFEKNSQVEIKLPALKVSNTYRVAERINNLLDEKDVLISPNHVSIWISTMHHHPATLIYRTKFTIGVLYQYLKIIEKNPEEELEKFNAWVYWYKPNNYEYPSTTNLAKRIRKMQKKTGVNSLQVLLDYEFKLTLKDYISGERQPKNPQEYFAKGLDYYKVTAVCLPDNLQWKNEVIKVLKNSNFRIIDSIDNFEIWKKDLPKNK